MHPILTRQPDGMNSTSYHGRDSESFAGIKRDYSAIGAEAACDSMMPVVNRIGDDNYDDGLVHTHGWAAAN